MKVAEFISLYRQNRPDGHFFDREALKFFGGKGFGDELQRCYGDYR